MFNTIHILYLAHPLTSGALIFAAGTFFGAHLNYRYGLRLARRLEFNLLADPARRALQNELDTPSPFMKSPSELEAIEDHLRFYKRHGYRKAVGIYKQARQEHLDQEPEYGTWSYARTDHIVSAIEALLPYLKRR